MNISGIFLLPLGLNNGSYLRTDNAFSAAANTSIGSDCFRWYKCVVLPQCSVLFLNWRLAFLARLLIGFPCIELFSGTYAAPVPCCSVLQIRLGSYFTKIHFSDLIIPDKRYVNFTVLRQTELWRTNACVCGFSERFRHPSPCFPILIAVVHLHEHTATTRSWSCFYESGF